MIIWHVLLLTYDSCATPRSNEVYWAGSRLFPGSSPSEWTSAELWCHNLKSIWRSWGENEGKRDYLGVGFSFRVQEVLGSNPRWAQFWWNWRVAGSFWGTAKVPEPHVCVHSLTIIYFFFFSSCYFCQTVILRREAVLLCSTAKVVHGHSLHVGASLDIIRIRNQIRETCEQEENAELIPELQPFMGATLLMFKAQQTKTQQHLCWSGTCSFFSF